MSKLVESVVVESAVAVVSVNGYKVNDSVVMEYVPNPKRPGFKAHSRYEEYKECKSIGEYMLIANTKYGRPDLRYDEEHGHLKLFVNGEQINVHE